jgi:hypothetical protein
MNIMGGILVLIGVLVFTYMTARGIDRYPWPWMSLVLFLFILISALLNIPAFTIALFSGLVVYFILRKMDEKGAP